MKKQISKKGNHFAASLIALSIFSMMVASVQVTYAQEGEEQVASDEGLTATLNGDTFRTGDEIVVSGTVSEREIGSNAAIEVIDPQGERVERAFPDITADNEFFFSFEAGGEPTSFLGEQMEATGNYRMEVTYFTPDRQREGVEFVFAYVGEEEIEEEIAAEEVEEAEETTITTTDEIPEGRVAIAEGSNATVQYYTYTPQTIEINVGENVTWYNQAELSDIHTVTFVLDESVMSDILLPFVVSGETEFEVLPPFNVGEPILVPTPDGREAIVAVNKEAFYPSIVGANNQTTYLNGTDIQYTINGTERVINSGIILPPLPPIDEETTALQTEEGQPLAFEPPFPLVNSFTVTFEESGTYPYICAIHPWMGGEVIVQGE